MLANGTVFSFWSHVPCFLCFILQTSAPAGLQQLNHASSGLSLGQPFLTLGHPKQFWTGHARASSPCCHVHGAHRRPIPTLRGAGKVCTGGELLSTHPSTAGTQPVPCKDLAAEDKQITLSLCIVWSSSDSLWVLGTCPIALLLLPFLPGASRDSHGLPVQDLFGLLGLVQTLAGCYFGAWIRNSANTSLKKKKTTLPSLNIQLTRQEFVG